MDAPSQEEIDLQRRLESIECEMYADLWAAAPTTLAESHGIRAERRGELLRLAVTAVDHPFFNRVLGLGLDPETDAASIEALARTYRDAGTRRFMFQVLPHVYALRPALTDAFQAQGFVKLRGWAKHVGTTDAVPAVPSDLRIADIGPASAQRWSALCAEGFSLPDALRPWLEATVGRPRWHHYLGYDGDAPVACGAFFAHGGVATLTFAATHPAARGRGAQSALIARRIRDAAASGCAEVVTETDEELPDRPNPSYHNVVRLGLPVRYVRANWGPPKPA